MGYAQCIEESTDKECACARCHLGRSAYKNYKETIKENEKFNVLVEQLHGRSSQEVGEYGLHWFMRNCEDLDLPGDTPPEIITVLANAFAHALVDLIEEERV